MDFCKSLSYCEKQRAEVVLKVTHFLLLEEQSVKAGQAIGL